MGPGDGAIPLMTATRAACTSPDPEAPGPANAAGEQKFLGIAFLTWGSRDAGTGGAALPTSPGTDSPLQGCDGQSLGIKLSGKGNSHSGLSC